MVESERLRGVGKYSGIIVSALVDQSSQNIGTRSISNTVPPVVYSLFLPEDIRH